MRLYFYRDSYGNFGDDLNPWLWGRLLREHIDDREDSLLVGIGTILNTNVPAGPLKLVMGSGTGYGDAPRLDDRWRFYAVRGPRTAERLGLDPAAAVTDGAALLRFVDLPGRPRGAGDPPRVAYMPHHHSTFQADWPAICRAAGVGYLAPAAPVDRLLAEMRRCSLVVTEAMHGAIVADALRVPWVAVRAYHHLNDFKWADWAQSLDISYEAGTLPAVFDRSVTSLRSRVRLKIRQVARTKRVRDPLPAAPPTVSSPEEFDRAARALAEAARGDRAAMSSDASFDARSSELRERVERLARDLADGVPGRQAFVAAAPAGTARASVG